MRSTTASPNYDASTRVSIRPKKLYELSPLHFFGEIRHFTGPNNASVGSNSNKIYFRALSSRKKYSSRTSGVSSQLRIKQAARSAYLASLSVTTKTASNLDPVKNQSIHDPKHLLSLRFQKNRQTALAFTLKLSIVSQNRIRLRALPPESKSKQPFASPEARPVVSNETSNEQNSTRGHETTKERRIRFFESGAPRTISARILDTRAHPYERQIFALEKDGNTSLRVTDFVRFRARSIANRTSHK